MSVIGGLLTGAALDKLLPILAKIGVPILADIVREKSPMAGRVVESIGEALGVEPTPEAIVQQYEADPTATATAIREVEAADPEMWKAIAAADRVRGEIFAAEAKEPWWAWAWRPFWMWLLGGLWVWQAAALALHFDHIDFGTLLTLTGIYTGLYMGGHTAKALWDGTRK